MKNFHLIYNKGQQSRVIVTVPKKVAKRAVDRNRIKRIFLEALKQMGKNEGEVIIRVKENVAHLKTADVKSELEEVLKKFR